MLSLDLAPPPKPSSWSLAVSEPSVVTPPLHPMRSPTYPQRVHIRERAQWSALLVEWRTRVAEASRTASGPGSDLRVARMQGALDQIAEAVARLPMEVGELYEEDRHSLEQAVAALERLTNA